MIEICFPFFFFFFFFSGLYRLSLSSLLFSFFYLISLCDSVLLPFRPSSTVDPPSHLLLQCRWPAMLTLACSSCAQRETHTHTSASFGIGDVGVIPTVSGGHRRRLVNLWWLMISKVKLQSIYNKQVACRHKIIVKSPNLWNLLLW